MSVEEQSVEEQSVEHVLLGSGREMRYKKDAEKNTEKCMDVDDEDRQARKAD